jgi:hypothetical protein
MADLPMDAFDDRLTGLMTAYADRAVTAYDAAAVARVATARRRRVRYGFGRALEIGRGTKLLLLAAAVALLVLAATFVATGSRPQPTPLGTIVLGRDGPEQSVYRVVARPSVEITLENRSDVTWLPWGGFTEKSNWCHLMSGLGVPGDPCAVGPHSTVALRPPSVPAGQHEIYFAPPGVDWQEGIHITVDVVAEP